MKSLLKIGEKNNPYKSKIELYRNLFYGNEEMMNTKITETTIPEKTIILNKNKEFEIISVSIIWMKN